MFHIYHDWIFFFQIYVLTNRMLEMKYVFLFWPSSECDFVLDKTIDVKFYELPFFFWKRVNLLCSFSLSFIFFLSNILNKNEWTATTVNCSILIFLYIVPHMFLFPRSQHVLLFTFNCWAHSENELLSVWLMQKY